MSTTATKSTKPCPFCGSNDIFVERMDTVVFRVFCNECAAMGPPFERAYDRKDEEQRQHAGAIRQWNKRSHTR